MALNKQPLAEGIEAMMIDLATRTDNPAQARADFANGLADLIDAYVRAAVVTVAVTTAGTAVAQTGTGSGGLS